MVRRTPTWKNQCELWKELTVNKSNESRSVRIEEFVGLASFTGDIGLGL